MSITTNSVTDIQEKSAISGGVITEAVVSGNYRPITDRIIKNKFQLYNRSRQKITSEVYSPAVLKPFQRFTDSKQGNKTFLLCSFRYTLTNDNYDVELYEYDNTTEINIF